MTEFREIQAEWLREQTIVGGVLKNIPPEHRSIVAEAIGQALKGIAVEHVKVLAECPAKSDLIGLITEERNALALFTSVADIFDTANPAVKWPRHKHPPQRAKCRPRRAK